MLATQTPDTPLEAKDVKQQIKEKLALSLKALQKRYVASDAVVTSEDGDANLLCSALEAIFIHAIKSKYIRSEAGSRSRKGNRGTLPQPFFWSLLKTVTHRDVITELEKLSFVSTDVGRCRAWLRLALNHGLLECYLASLFREGSKLQAHYQPTALLLNLEEREVLLSYLQGLASLTFSLSYKSAVLNEWTTTPLALAGLCPMSQAEALDLPLNGRDPITSKRKESWDTVSQSSGSSDAVELQKGGVGVPGGRGSCTLTGGRTALNSSNLSLDTTGSSQLSSSLSSDSLLQGQDPCSPTGEQWSSCDLDMSPNGSAKRPLQDVPTDFRESGHCSQDSMREDSFVSSTGPDHLSETATFSGSDSEAHVPADGLVPDLGGPGPDSLLPDSEPSSHTNHPDHFPSEESFSSPSELHSDPLTPSSAGEPVERVHMSAVQENTELIQKHKEVENSAESISETSESVGPRLSILSRKTSSESLSHSHSWISEDDIYKPQLEEVSDLEEASTCVNGLSSPTSEPTAPPSAPSVIHRRQIGLSNPFRGLLKLGHLERRGAVGMWRDYYCELSPFEFRLYLNAEERTCCDNCSLVRCEDARVTLPEGRFELAFSGKRLYLRAANRDEAEDWVDRVVEAVNKCRPAPRMDEQWEVLQAPDENGLDEPSFPSPSSAPSSPERGSIDTGMGGGQQDPPPQELDWTRTADLEPEAIKEAVLYLSTDPEARTWVPMVFSLSLEALKGFRVQEGRKSLRLSHSIEDIRDVVPDVSLGGPAFFKLLTFRETLRLRAESPEEATSWRSLIRGALDSYLESGDDGGSESPAIVSLGVGGNIHRLVQHRLKEDGALLSHLCTVPSEKGLDMQNFKCAGDLGF
ncbi:pleckstrin homology domain-containing family M member 1 [Diretmus argenteus]